MPMIEHAVWGEGISCGRCGLPRSSHRPKRIRVRSHKREDIGNARADRRKVYDSARGNRKADRLIVGIDGEGQDDANGNHIYTYMAAVNERGRTVAEAFNCNGLTHDECMEMLLSIPKNTLKFAFSFGYDITMMIRDMPDAVKYKLLRPDTRSRRNCKPCGKSWNALISRDCPRCKNTETTQSRPYYKWNGRGYDWFNNAITVASGYDKEKGKWGRSCHVWDSFRFFGTSFVEALKDWNIGGLEQRARVADMKGKRGSFSEEKPEEIQAYCREECHLLALMMRKVINAHDEAGLHLERYDGAGSTASVMMKVHGVAEFKGPKIKDMAPELGSAIMAGFFGGRFENSAVGVIDREVFGFDISSAYPYAQTSLPCLRCGRWERANPRKRLQAIERGSLAICKFRVGKVDKLDKMAWLPLPFRDEKGSICYPANFEGWAWRPEAMAALAGWPDIVKITDAYVYTTDCDHVPFAHIPAVYRQRIEWGKEGAGKALKLGLNAGYGKNAQSVGDNPPYQQWVWAGMTTASTRGQILEGIALANDRWNVLSIATDGIYAIEDLQMPTPRDTGTAEVTVLQGDEKGKVKAKPLGGWERKAIPEGAFFAKPGLYFRLNPELNDIRARGVGRREVYEEKTRLIEGFHSWDRKDYEYSIPLVGRRFYGAKHCVLMRSGCKKCDTSWPGVPERKCPTCRKIGSVMTTSQMQTPKPNQVDAYGRWAGRTTYIKFDPRPKRERVFDGDKKYGRLRVRDVEGLTSQVYNPGQTTPEGAAMRDVQSFMLEQPDWDDGKGQP